MMTDAAYSDVGSRKLSEIPSDLYIPHDAMKVALDEFTTTPAPISDQERKLRHIELAIAPITEQYMNFTTMDELDESGR